MPPSRSICALAVNKTFLSAWATQLRFHAMHLIYDAIGTMRAGNAAAAAIHADLEGVLDHLELSAND